MLSTLSVRINPEWAHGKKAKNTINLPLRAACVTVMLGPNNCTVENAWFRIEFNLFSTDTLDVQLVTRADSEEKAVPRDRRALLWFDGHPFGTFRNCVQLACFRPEL